MGTGSFPGVKRPGRGVNHPPSSSTRVKERLELYLYSPSEPSRHVLGRPLPYLYLAEKCKEYRGKDRGRGMQGEDLLNEAEFTVISVLVLMDILLLQIWYTLLVYTVYDHANSTSQKTLLHYKDYTFNVL
jgi:hypothetical protein